MPPMHRRSFLAMSAAVAAVVAVRPARASLWDAHLAKLKNAVKCKAALFGLDGLQWAGLEDIKPTAEEVKALIAGFGKRDLLAAGAKVCGEKFMCTREEPELIVLKRGPHGVVFAKSKQAATLCWFDESQTTPAQATAATLQFADYLSRMGF